MLQGIYLALLAASKGGRRNSPCNK